MGDNDYRDSRTMDTAASLEYDLADAIYAACLADSLNADSLFYFMDTEDGGTSMYARASLQRRAA